MALLAQWLLAEASSGSVPTSAADNSGNENTLTVNYGSGDGAGTGSWFDTGAGNGFRFSGADNTSNAAILSMSDIAANGNIGSALDGSTKAAIEIVVTMQRGSSVGARLFHIGQASANGDFGVTVALSGEVVVRWNNGGDITFPAVVDDNTHVFVEVDTTQASLADRVKCWYNGAQQIIVSGTVAQNTTITTNTSDRYVAIGNRPSGNRGAGAIIGLVTLYDDVGRTSAQVSALSLAAANDNDADPSTNPVQLSIDSRSASMQRNESFAVVISNPATTPTTANTTLSNGNDTLTPASVSGVGPYTISFDVGDMTKQIGSYSWVLDIASETISTGLIPLNIQVGWSAIVQNNPVTTEGSVFYQYTGDAPQTGWHVEYENVTSPSGIAVSITETGGINLASTPTQDETFQFRAVEPDGTISSTQTFTYELVQVINTPATGQPSITGTPRVGETLGVNTSAIADAEGLGNFTYQWMLAGSPIGGAASSTYTPVAGDVGQNVSVAISFSDGEGNIEGPLISNAVTVQAAQQSNTPATGQPAITGTPRVGETLGVNTSAIADAEGLGNFTYQWMLAGSPIGGAASSTYTPVAGDVGQNVSVAISFSDGEGNIEGPLISNAVTIQSAQQAGDPVISGPGTLTVMLPADESSLASSHAAVAAWVLQWAAVDSEGNPASVSVSVPQSMQVADSPVSVLVTATDNNNRSSTTSTQIVISQLSEIRSDVVIIRGNPKRHAQRGTRFFVIDE